MTDPSTPDCPTCGGKGYFFANGDEYPCSCAAGESYASSEDLGPLLERVIGSAIDSAVSQHERGFVTKWVALVESVDPDGQRGLWTMTSEDVKAWDTVGLLQHGLHLQQAETLRGGPDAA